MDIQPDAQAREGRKRLRNRTYRSVQPGDVLDFGPGSQIRYREAVGYGVRLGTKRNAYVDVRVIGGIAPCWVDDSKFDILRKVAR